MHTSKKINELLSKKYLSNIQLFGNYNSEKSALLIDANSSTLFSVMDNFLFSFKDKDDNCWSTIPKSLIINGEQYSAKVGDNIIRDDGIKHFFTTKEQVIQMAFEYFDKYVNLYYGLIWAFSESYYQEVINDHETKSFKLIEFKFKAAAHKKIKYYINAN